MRQLKILTLLLPALAIGGIVGQNALEGTAIDSSRIRASPAPSSSLGSVVATPSVGFENIELRQAPAAPNNAVYIPIDAAVAQPNPAVPTTTTTVAPAAAPVDAPVNPAVPVNPVAPIVPANPNGPGLAPGVNPAAPAPAPTTPTTTRPPLPADTADFVTTQWVETWIGGTSQTWVPKTVTLHYDPEEVPPPGEGHIGMGTITGVTGKTKTIHLGAAPSKVPSWVKGVAAAVGVGVVGVMV